MKKYIFLILLVLLMMTSLTAEPSYRQKAVHWLASRGVSPEWTTVIISTMPIIELRGAIPVAVFVFEFPWWKALLLSIFGNMLPMPLILLFWDGITRLLQKFPLGAGIVNWIFKRTRRKGRIIEQYEAAGLILFVGIPLPGTGGWTGALAANIFGLRFWKSLLCIFWGVLLAGLTVSFLCAMGVFALR